MRIFMLFVFLTSNCNIVMGQAFPPSIDGRAQDAFQFPIRLECGTEPAIIEQQLTEAIIRNGLEEKTANLLSLLFSDLNRYKLCRLSKHENHGISIAARWQSVILNELDARTDCCGNLQTPLKFFLDRVRENLKCDPPQFWLSNLNAAKFDGVFVRLPQVNEQSNKGFTVSATRPKFPDGTDIPIEFRSKAFCNIQKTPDGNVLTWKVEKTVKMHCALVRDDKLIWSTQIQHAWDRHWRWPDVEFDTLIIEKRVLVFFCFVDHFGYEVFDISNGNRLESFNTMWPKLFW